MGALNALTSAAADVITQRVNLAEGLHQVFWYFKRTRSIIVTPRQVKIAKIAEDVMRAQARLVIVSAPWGSGDNAFTRRLTTQVSWSATWIS